VLSSAICKFPKCKILFIDLAFFHKFDDREIVTARLYIASNNLECCMTYIINAPNSLPYVLDSSQCLVMDKIPAMENPGMCCAGKPYFMCKHNLVMSLFSDCTSALVIDCRLCSVETLERGCRKCYLGSVFLFCIALRV
jgi:hypothetical protein